MKKFSFVGMVVMFSLIFVCSAPAKLPSQNRTSSGDLSFKGKEFNIVGGRVQMFLRGYAWRFSSSTPGLKVWVLEKSNSPTAKDSWRLLGENEATPGGFTIVRIKVGDDGTGTVKASGIIDKNTRYSGVALSLAEISLLASRKLIESDELESLMSGKISYEFMTPDGECATLMEDIIKDTVKNIVPGKSLYGFIVQDNGGFLNEIIKVDQKKIGQDPDYLTKIFKNAMIEDFQFVVAIFKDLKR